MKAFLLMGQSNMAGRGNIEDVETIRDENIKVFRMGSFIVDREPFGYDRRAAGIGLCGSFGLKFVEEDNEDWKKVDDGVVATEKLKDTLLNPGESAVVEIVLTWKNSSTNLGLKTNYAEISSASSTDIDSIPDNYDFTEDDMDDAQVILSIKTSGTKTYIGLVLTAVVILAGGVLLIKKYVLD